MAGRRGKCAIAAAIAVATLATPWTAAAAQTSPPAIVSPEPLAQAERLARQRLAHLPQPDPSAPDAPGPGNPRGWQQAVFWIGLAALADHIRQPWAREAVLAHGRANDWRPGPRPYNADDQLIGQAYVWAAQHGAGEAALAPLRAKLDAILARPPRTPLALHVSTGAGGGYPQADALRRWCWSDALFMAPPTWLALYRQTGDRRYRDYALAEFWASTAFLYDPAERLYFRDSRFFDLRDGQGRKLFWSRGNGWAFAALPRMIDALPPTDPDRDRLAGLYRQMAQRLRDLQRPDGYWSASLLAPEGATPETSGTALFTYGLAWGVARGVLPRAGYLPAVRKGWTALERAIQPDGRLGWVQPVGDRPEPATADDARIYAAGAFLLAATAVSEIPLRP